MNKGVLGLNPRFDGAFLNFTKAEQVEQVYES